MTLETRKLKTIFGAALGVLIVAEQAALPVFALKNSYGAVAGYKKILSGVEEGSEDDLAYSPILLDMAKVIGRSGLPPGFFLHNDSPFPDQPGIDLRTLLLYQAGLLKMPVRIGGPNKSNPDVPTLAFPSLRSTPTGPIVVPQESNLPKLNSVTLPGEPNSSQVVAPKREVGDPGKVSINTGSEPISSHTVSFDAGSFSETNRSPIADGADDTSLTANLPTTGMFIPRPSAMPFVTRSVFRLWTYRPGSTSASGKHTAQVDPYQGTFVVVSGPSFKGISGRSFRLAPGKILASNQSGDLSFKTDFAEVSVEPEATALIELTAKGTLQVKALESNAQHSVVVILKGGEKPKTITLSQGEELVTSNRELLEEDFAGTSLGTKNKQSALLARGTFSVTSVATKEALLKSDSISNDEHRSAIAELRRRLQIP